MRAAENGFDPDVMGKEHAGRVALEVRSAGQGVCFLGGFCFPPLRRTRQLKGGM